MEIRGSFKVCLLVLVLIFHTLKTYAQIPPTCCPDPIPEDKFNVTPILIAGGGLLIAGGSYFYLKNKGAKMPVQAHLTSYLLARNILPNDDALNLMFSLNPNLNGKSNIREDKILVNPVFPAIPNEKLNFLNEATAVTFSNSQILRNQIGILNSNIKFHRSSNLSYESADSVFSKKIRSDLSEIDKVVSKIENNLPQSNDVINKLTTDLILVLNRTLEKLKKESSEVEKNSILIQDILANLIDISSSNISSSHLVGRNSYSTLNSKENWENLLAYIQIQSSDQEEIYQSDRIITNSATSASNANSKLLKGFAFAVYTFGEDGEPISKGAEVEGRYMVKYAMPALKDEISTHRETDGLASYALAMLPPAKLYIVVLDISDGGKIIPLQNPLVDFKVAFRYTGRENINDQEFIIVPIYLAK